MGEGRHTPSISRGNLGTVDMRPFPKYGLQVFVLSVRWGWRPLTVISTLGLDLVSSVERAFSIERRHSHNPFVILSLFPLLPSFMFK